MTSIYDKNFRKFAFIFKTLQVLQCEKMKFRNAWPRREEDQQQRIQEELIQLEQWETATFLAQQSNNN